MKRKNHSPASCWQLFPGISEPRRGVEPHEPKLAPRLTNDLPFQFPPLVQNEQEEKTGIHNFNNAPENKRGISGLGVEPVAYAGNRA